MTTTTAPPAEEAAKESTNKTPGAKDRVVIFDTTLRDGEQSPGCTMNRAEKMEVAHQLARLGVDIIEAGFPICSPDDFESVEAIATEIGGREGAPVICGLARTLEKDIVRAGEAIKPARRGRIHTFIATSSVHLEKKLRMTKERVIQQAQDAVMLAKTYTDDIEFSCEDAGRTDWDYIVDVVTAAIEAGATTINIPDTVGYCAPAQYGECIRYVREKVPGSERAVFSVHCHNDLGLAVANSLAGVANGARQVECTINGLGERAGNASLEEIVMNLRVRGDFYGVDTGINAEEIYRSSRLVSQITGMRVQRNKAIVGANAFAHEAGIHQDGVLKERSTYEIMRAEDVGWTGENLVLGKHSGRHAFGDRLKKLGFGEMDKERLNKLFEEFIVLCDKKREVYDQDIIALVEQELSRDEDRADMWVLDRVQVIAGNDTMPSAVVAMRRASDDEAKTFSHVGDGPIDAIFKAINKLTGAEDLHLAHYGIEAITRGRDALGQASLRIERGGFSATGTSADTDILVASAEAYVEALNRLEFQEARVATEDPTTTAEEATV